MANLLNTQSSTTLTSNFIPPAQQLLGRDLPGGWKVVERISRHHNATGGNFSEGYIVEKASGQRGFLKALDYSGALQTPDPANALQAMTAAYIFERELLKRCRDRRLDRVATAIGEGSITIDNNPIGVVQYLIFELAQGDIRRHVKLGNQLVGDYLTMAWSLRVLHHTATGLQQLHRQDIAHQDLKPSNILVFSAKSAKVADLGRAACRSLAAPHDNCEVAGDWSYAPPELLYGNVPADWNVRRFGCDAYHLGSMVVFLFAGVQMTSLIMYELDAAHHWRQWQGSFGDVLPFVQDAFARALVSTKAALPLFQEELLEIVRQLCEPDPEKRGHPRTRGFLGNPLSLERYVSKFDLLARKAEINLVGKAIK